jgi:hypothetical protein
LVELRQSLYWIVFLGFIRMCKRKVCDGEGEVSNRLTYIATVIEVGEVGRVGDHLLEALSPGDVGEGAGEGELLVKLRIYTKLKVGQKRGKDEGRGEFMAQCEVGERWREVCQGPVKATLRIKCE